MNTTSEKNEFISLELGQISSIKFEMSFNLSHWRTEIGGLRAVELIFAAVPVLVVAASKTVPAEGPIWAKVLVRGESSQGHD